jgi:plastocyanin
MKQSKLLALLLLLTTPLAFAADHLVVLKQKAFEPESIKVRVGDSVEFRNADPFDHTVLSQSAAKAFDFDPLPPGQSRKVTFDKAGKVEVDCGVHSSMHLTIQVDP